MPLSLKNLDMIFSFTPPNQMLTSVLKRVDVAAAVFQKYFWMDIISLLRVCLGF